MDDSYIIANFHKLCRLCLTKSNLMASIFCQETDDDPNFTLTSKIANCFQIQIVSNDGLPDKICYKCLYDVNKCSQFRLQCVQSENRLRQLISQVSEIDSTNQMEPYVNSSQESMSKMKSESYVVEESVVMVVDPSMDYDSTGESDNAEQRTNEQAERVLTPDTSEATHESFFRDIAMCQYCDQAFVTQEKCLEHEHSYHDPKLPYNCTECSLVFSERTQHIQHTRHVHGNDKPYHCLQCDKGFGRRSDLRRHAIVHTGIRPYQCHYCFKNFSRNTNLSKHLRIHAGEKPHVCPYCPRSFVANGDLQRHLTVHSGQKPHACTKCPMTFTRKDKLVKHEEKHADPNYVYQETNMVVNVNPFNNLLLPPTEANSGFDLPSVPDHIMGESSFINQVHKVPSTSAQPKQLTPSKVKSPLKNRPKNIKCHQCTKRFSSLDAYKSHVTIAHIGSRVFQCKICFKKFIRKRELDKHVVIHSGMKPFSCKQCDKKFTRRDKLVKHEEMQECLVVNMPCIECGVTFEKKGDLVAHIKSHFTNDLETNGKGIMSDLDKKDYLLDNGFDNLET